LISLTIKLPWIIVVEIEAGDDVPLAEGLAVEEMDDEFFVGGEELEARRERSHDERAVDCLYELLWVCI